jgi:uncharacterized membrane protein
MLEGHTEILSLRYLRALRASPGAVLTALFAQPLTATVLNID